MSSCDVLERAPSRQGSVISERRGSLTDIVSELIDGAKSEDVKNTVGAMTAADNEDQARQVQNIVRLAERFQSEGEGDQLVDLVKNVQQVWNLAKQMSFPSKSGFSSRKSGFHRRKTGFLPPVFWCLLLDSILILPKLVFHDHSSKRSPRQKRQNS